MHNAIQKYISILSSSNEATNIYLPHLSLNDDDIYFMLEFLNKNLFHAYKITHINLMNNNIKIQIDLSCFVNLENACLQNNGFELPPKLPKNNKIKWLNLSGNPLKIAPYFNCGPKNIDMYITVEKLTLIAKLALKTQGTNSFARINSKKGQNILPGLLMNSFTSKVLQEHFSCLLAPKNTNLIHYIALVLARLEILPAVINAKIMSFLYDNNIADEIEKLLELFPDKQQDINNFVDAEPNTQCGLYYMQENYKTKKLAKLATIAENVAGPKKAPVKTGSDANTRNALQYRPKFNYYDS